MGCHPVENRGPCRGTAAPSGPPVPGSVDAGNSHAVNRHANPNLVSLSIFGSQQSVAAESTRDAELDGGVLTMR